MKTGLSFLCCLLSLAGRAQTQLSGGIYSNTTLTETASPYLVTGNVVVFEGVTLTIEPGVELKVDSGKRIDVRGNIVAAGTSAKRISVHGNTATHSQWFWTGFILKGTGNFNYCDVSDARTCFDLNAAYAGPYWFRNSVYTYNRQVNDGGGMYGTYFENCTFKYNYTGLTDFQFGGRVSNSVFDSNEFGLSGTDTIINCQFTNHSQIAMQPYGYTAGCTITNNNVGVRCGFNSVNNTFVNNTVKDNTVGMYISSYFNNYITFTGNTICNNATNNIELSTGNNTDLSHNCWCTTDSAAIRNSLLDGYKDVNRGLITFMPVQNACKTAGVPAATTGTLLPTISPNPVQPGAPLTLQWGGGRPEKAQVRIYNLLGQPVPFQQTRTDAREVVLRLAAPAGTCLLTVTDESTGQRVASRILIRE